jgi:hypothetical protein
MTARTIGLGAPYRWLSAAFTICRAHPRALLSAALVLTLVALVPTLLQLLIETALRPSDTVRTIIQIFFMVVPLVIFPPLVGGFYRLVHALHSGRPAEPLDILAVYQEPLAARRLIVTNLIFTLISIGVVVGLAYSFGGAELLEFLRAMATLQPGATEFPPVPAGLLPLLSALSILIMVIVTAQGLATAQVALSGSAPLAAIGSGFAVALRNIATFLLFYLPAVVVGFLIIMAFVMVAALIGMVLSVVSPMLAAALLMPLGLVAVVVLYALMFTFFYHAWLDTLGSSPAIPDEHQLIA